MTADDVDIRIIEEKTESSLPEREPDITIRETDLIGPVAPETSDKKVGADWQPNQVDYTAPSKEPVDIVLLIDTSGSMGADDYPPDRLSAAKEAARMFTRRKVIQGYDDRVCVIGFGGTATVAHHLDTDLEKVALAIDALKMTHSGSMVGVALQVAFRELAHGKNRRRAIVLLSDGADEYDSSEPAKIAGGMQGTKVFTIGIGTTKGGMAALPHGRQRVYLNEDLLRQIAKITGGDYLYAPDVLRLQEVYLKLADY